MGLGVQPEDLDIDSRLIFTQGEEAEFVCLDTTDNVTKESIALKCKVLTGEHAGKFHTMYLSKKRTFPVLIRKLRDFAKAFYSEEELRSGDQPLSRLYLRKFSAVAEAPRQSGDRVYQDFGRWKDLGESDPEAPSTAAHTSAPSHDTNIPF